MNDRIPAAHARAASVGRLCAGHRGRAAEELAASMIEAQDAIGAGRASRRPHHGREILRGSERLGADDHSPSAARRRAAGVVGRGDAGVEPDGEPELGDRPDDRGVVARARDRVEIRDVARVAAETLLEGARESDGLRRRAQHALDGRVGMALAANRVDRHAALEIEHRHDAHRGREDSTPTGRRASDRTGVIAETGGTR